MSAAEHWWKIVVDTDGKVRSCQRVDKAETDGGGVLYVRAVDGETAGKVATRAYFAANNRRRRARYAQEGKCKCGRKRDNDAFRQCSECRRLGQEHHKRAEARERGEVVPPRERTVAVQQRRASEAEQARLTVLLEVQDAWLSQPTNRQFTAWLKQQIEAIAGKRVA